MVTESRYDDNAEAPETTPQLRSRTTMEERKTLMCYLVRVPGVFLEARTILATEHFTEPYEMIFALIWRVTRDQYDECGVLPSHATLESECVSRLEGNPGVLPDSAVDEIRDFLHRAFVETELAELSGTFEAYGYRLLVTFLNERHWTDPIRKYMEELGENIPIYVREFWAKYQGHLDQIQAIGARASTTVANEWADHLSRTAAYRGRRFIGMPTGWPQFDRLTRGLRGTMLLTSPPGAGKSTLYLQAALGAIRQNVDVCAVYITLEMSVEDTLNRIHANLAELPLSTVLHGSPSLCDGNHQWPENGPFHTEADQRKLNRATEQVQQFGGRLRIVDRKAVGHQVDADAIRAVVARHKRECGATNAVIVLDYLNLLPVPHHVERHGEQACDRWRIAEAQRIIEGTPTDAYPEGDALLAICESRKPASRDQGWGEGMAEIMGSARQTYAATCVIHFRGPTEDELHVHYHHTHAGLNTIPFVLAQATAIW